MWGIQISSSNPQQLGKVIIEINQEIAKTQQLIQETYAKLDQLAVENQIDPEFKSLLEDDLGYTSIFDPYRTLSMTDMLIRNIAAKDPHENAMILVEEMTQHFKQPKYKDYIESVLKQGKQPFGRFLAVRGLKYCPFGDKPELNNEKDCHWKDPKNPDVQVLPWKDLTIVGVPGVNTRVEFETWRSRQVVLNFALNYAHYIQNPNQFDAYRLQQAAGNLNTRLKPVVDAINRDVADLFIEPTLVKIQEIVSRHKDVEYAQVGKTSVAGLNGIQSIVTANTISARSYALTNKQYCA
jgi:hypothetical protein